MIPIQSIETVIAALCPDDGRLWFFELVETVHVPDLSPCDPIEIYRIIGNPQNTKRYSYPELALFSRYRMGEIPKYKRVTDESKRVAGIQENSAVHGHNHGDTQQIYQVGEK